MDSIVTYLGGLEVVAPRRCWSPITAPGLWLSWCYIVTRQNARLRAGGVVVVAIKSESKMPARRAKAKASPGAANTSKSSVPSSIQNPFFPYARYTSVVGVHTSLIAFTALFLPQTSRLFWQPETKTTDRPQSEFVDALTDSPVATLAWIVAGLLILQPWWAGWIRQWSFEYTSRGTADEIKLDKLRFQEGRFSVRFVYLVVQILISLAETGESGCFHFMCSTCVPRDHSVVWRSVCKVTRLTFSIASSLNAARNIKSLPSYPPAGDCSSTAILVRTRLRSRCPDIPLLRQLILHLVYVDSLIRRAVVGQNLSRYTRPWPEIELVHEIR